MSDTLQSLQKALHEKGLEVVGFFYPDQADNLSVEIKTILLIGPEEPRFWHVFKNSKEYGDKIENPLDRWSKKTIELIAREFKARSFFPFEAPFQPFISWAKKCDTMGSSPVGLLVHEKKGLFISFRGALGINEYIKRPTPSKDICTSCLKPCLTACPIEALTSNGYDVGRCRSYLQTTEGKDCKEGCLVRRSCPIGSQYRLKDQSSFHMSSFLE